MKPDHHPATFRFRNRPLVLRASVPEPPPQSVTLHVAITSPESRDYHTIAGAEVPFRLDRERDGNAEYGEVEAGDPGRAEPSDVYTHVPMPAEMAKLLHAGKLTSAEVVATVLGVPSPANRSPPSDGDEGLHGLSDAPGG
jgi:hypothetical protein